ncbi:ribbon-helix-helix domain-containing protein [Sphingomonas ursincola]|uniref:ribbon-helix-helix domain-containing protein n=1 Tax=Sphingomonas ursincola TaxID=56361 RepID=UPI002355CFCC|nr:ribbon-helix-helix domain-containing protein [Sphingomonas ursincola]
MSIRATTKRKGRPATGKGVPISVRLQPDQLAALDAWIEAQGGGISRPEAVRRIIGAATVKAS